MKLLVDTHLLIWAAKTPEMLSASARSYIGDRRHQLVFSAASIWEIAIKRTLRKPDFDIDTERLLNQLRRADYAEMPVSSAHGRAVESLPPIHKDPFDRMLIAQAAVEELTLLTADTIIARYPGSIIKV